MSAADLFKDCGDVDFRLLGTYIVVGRKYYYVKNVQPSDTSSATKDTVLTLVDSGGYITEVPLGKLPLSAMFNCPHGYYDDVWVARGPARHRFQGLTKNSWWYTNMYGETEAAGFSDCARILERVLPQKRIRRPGPVTGGLLTRDVFVTGNAQVLSRGKYVAVMTSDVEAVPVVPISMFTERLLLNAGLKLKNL